MNSTRFVSRNVLAMIPVRRDPAPFFSSLLEGFPPGEFSLDKDLHYSDILISGKLMRGGMRWDPGNFWSSNGENRGGKKLNPAWYFHFDFNLIFCSLPIRMRC